MTKAITFNRRPVSWLRYFDGALHAIGPDIHEGEPEYVRSRLHASAYRQGTKIQTKIEDDTLWVQVVPGARVIEPRE